jgi:hypothetical protein
LVFIARVRDPRAQSGELCRLCKQFYYAMVYYRSAFRNQNRTRYPHRKCNSPSRAPDHHARIGTINCRQWNPKGDNTEVDTQRAKGRSIAEWMRSAKIDIMLCTELYWRENDVARRSFRTQKIDEFLFFPNGQVGIMVHKQWASRIREVKRFGPRNMTARLGNIGICVTYGPYKQVDVKNARYHEEKNACIEHVLKRGLQPVMGGDWNSAIGSKCEAWGDDDESRPEAIGRYGGECSAQGVGVAEWAESWKLRVADTFCRIHKRCTFRSLANRWLELDYFVVDARVKVMRIEARTSCVITDHRCKIATIAIRKSRADKQLEREQRKIAAHTSERYDFEKLRSLEHGGKRCRVAWANATDDELRPTGHIAGESQEDWIEREWTELHGAMIRAAENVLGKRRGAPGYAWENQHEIRGLHRKTRQVLKELGSAVTRDAKKEVQERVSAHRAEIAEKRRTWFEQHLQAEARAAQGEFQNETQKTNIAGRLHADVKLAYRHFKNIRDTVPGTVAAGAKSAFSAEQARKHFAKVGAKERPWDDRFPQELTAWTPRRTIAWELDRLPSNDEVKKVVFEMKESATGTDAIHITMIRWAGTTWFPRFVELVRVIWHAGWVPKGWLLVKMMPLWKGAKSGPASDLDAHRAVALVQVAARIISKVWTKRLYLYAERGGLIPENQFGFRRRLGTTEALLVLRILLEQYQKYECDERDEIVLISHDIRKAFPSVCRRRMQLLLSHIGVPPRMMVLYDKIHAEAAYFCSVAGESSQTFRLASGHKEGDPSSPLCYTLLAACILASLKRRAPGITLRYDDTYQDAMRKQNRRAGATVKITHIAFADDTTGVAKRQNAAAEGETAKEVFDMNGLVENDRKKEAVGLQPPRTAARPRMECEKDTIRILGGRLMRTARYDAEDATRIAQAMRAWAVWRPRLRRAKGLMPWEVGNLLKQNVLSALAQDCFARPWTKASLSKMEVVWGKVCREAAGWSLPAMKGKANMSDLRNIMGLTTFATWVERLRVGWLRKVLFPRDENSKLWRRVIFGMPADCNGRFRAGNHNRKTCRMEMHQQLEKIAGRKYMELVVTAGEGHWDQLFEQRLQRLVEEDLKCSYLFGKEGKNLDEQRKQQRRETRGYVRDNYHTMTRAEMMRMFEDSVTLGSRRRRDLEHLGESGAVASADQQLPGLRDTVPTVRTARGVQNTLFRERQAGNN